MFNFKIIHQDEYSQARTGEIKTSHGKFSTPCFMPVGTQASVKALSPKDLKEIGTEIILANAYHLYLRPGVSVIKKAGSLHNFMNWSSSILTDSGGYQVFSLGGNKGIKRKIKGNEGIEGDRRGNKEDVFSRGKLVRVTDKGVEFCSHLDGSLHYLTPEDAIKIQKDIGADIIMAFDECIPYPSSKKYTRQAMERTHKWVVKCLKAFENQKSKIKNQKELNPNQTLFGITQGGFYKDLRKESAKFLASLDFPGYGIGGLSVGEPRKLTWQMLAIQTNILPKDKPRYLMGVGEPKDFFEAIERGVDMFDSAMPTRMARNGTVWSKEGRLNLRLNKYKLDGSPIDKNCGCYVCQNFSRSYLRHLILSSEVLGIRLTTYHNLYFVLDLIKQIRESIKKGQFLKFKKEFLRSFKY